jgi:hypothetical protein
MEIGVRLVYMIALASDNVMIKKIHHELVKSSELFYYLDKTNFDWSNFGQRTDTKKERKDIP